MDAVEHFSMEATLFEQWARNGTDCGPVAAREALIRITRLYLAALDLPPEWNDELANQKDAERVGDSEWGAVFTASSRLPIQSYGKVFDPLLIPSEESIEGNLSDDIADIYGDVVSSLRAYQAGMRASAIWEWGFNLHIHWGDHATSAIRALHCWLAENAFAYLQSDR